MNTGYPAALAQQELLATPVAAASLDIAACGAEPFELQHRFRIERTGTLHGIGGWFSAQLSRSVTLTNAPDAAQRINRRNAFLPIDQPVAVESGDEVDVHVHVIPGALVATWTVEVRRASRLRGRFRHSTMNGTLFAREDLRKMHPTYVPKLTPRGVARRLVLELCDGSRPLAEVERTVFSEHPHLFATAADAQVFVSEVVTGYTR